MKVGSKLRFALHKRDSHTSCLGWKWSITAKEQFHTNDANSHIYSHTSANTRLLSRHRHCIAHLRIAPLRVQDDAALREWPARESQSTTKATNGASVGFGSWDPKKWSRAIPLMFPSGSPVYARLRPTMRFWHSLKRNNASVGHPDWRVIANSHPS